jgi:hypothetical protein
MCDSNGVCITGRWWWWWEVKDRVFEGLLVEVDEYVGEVLYV